jgi:TM2 domain-containing membrane protein YozV
MAMVHCRECGAKISDSAPTCPKCGAKQFGSSSNKDKDRVTAGILALLLGGFGVHKFYLNKSSQGVLYLLFFWTLIPSILALIDGIKYLTSTDEDFQRKYV